MLFCSQAFLLFFLLVFTAYWALPWQRARVWLLVLASLYFYACWNKWLACLIGLSTTVDYFLAPGHGPLLRAASTQTARERQHPRQPGDAVLFQIRQLLLALP